MLSSDVRLPPAHVVVAESTLHLVLRLRGGIIEPSLQILARKYNQVRRRSMLNPGGVAAAVYSVEAGQLWAATAAREQLRGQVEGAL